MTNKNRFFAALRESVLRIVWQYSTHSIRGKFGGLAVRAIPAFGSGDATVMVLDAEAPNSAELYDMIEDAAFAQALVSLGEDTDGSYPRRVYDQAPKVTT